MTNTTKQQKIKLNLGKQNGTLTLSDFSALEAWFSEEKSKFNNWISSASRKNRNISTIHNSLNQQWRNIDSKINQVKQHINAENFESHLNGLVQFIEQIYSEGKLLNSTSPRGKFVFKEKEKDEVSSAFALAYFINLGITSNEPKSLEGAFIALQFDKGIKSNIDSEKGSLQELRSKWESEYNSSVEQYSEASKNTKELNDKYEKQIKDQSTQFTDSIKNNKKSFDDLIEVYDKKLALQSSTSYWDKKRKSHRLFSIIFGFISLSLGCLIAYYLNNAIQEILQKTNKPEYWQLITIAIYTSLAVWVMRILVRIFLSNLHLATDAKERVTMITTYIAMLREKDGLKDEEKQLILQTVFRPSSTGIIKDEASPPTIVDIFAKLNGKK